MQDLLVFLIVGAATFYLGRSWWLASRGGGCASGCGGCKSAKPTAEAPLVQIELGASFDRSNASKTLR